MDIRVVWLLALAIVWLPAIFKAYDTMAIAIVTVFSISLTLIMINIWITTAFRDYINKNKGDE